MCVCGGGCTVIVRAFGVDTILLSLLRARARTSFSPRPTRTTTCRLQQAKILSSAGPNLSRNATYGVGILGSVIAVIVLLLNLSGKVFLTTALGAVIYVVMAVVYFAAARKLQAAAGKSNASGIRIAGLSRRIAITLALGILNMLTFTIVWLKAVVADLPTLGYIIPIFLYFGIHGAFGLGHWFLLSFLNQMSQGWKKKKNQVQHGDGKSAGTTRKATGGASTSGTTQTQTSGGDTDGDTMTNITTVTVGNDATVGDNEP